MNNMESSPNAGGINNIAPSAMSVEILGTREALKGRNPKCGLEDMMAY